MKKILSLLALLAMAAAPTIAQHGKTLPSNTAAAPVTAPRLNWPGKAVVPAAPNPFGAATTRPKPMPMLQTSEGAKISEISITRGENGLPIFFEGKTAVSGSETESKPVGERALDYCASLFTRQSLGVGGQGIAQPKSEFTVKTIQTDEQGNSHVRMEQVFNGLPVWGGELICHTQHGAFSRMNGRYFPTPALSSIVPVLDAETAILKVKTEIGLSKIKADWSEADLKLIEGQPFSATLIVFHPKENLSGERLTWHVAARPNVFSRSEWFIDAATGEVLNHFEHTCNLLGHLHGIATNDHCTNPQFTNYQSPIPQSPTEEEMPVTVSGVDLLGINRSFVNGGWQAGQFYLEDASKTMFNSSASNMPTDPVGVIVTLDAMNTSPENQNFNVDFVVSNSSTFTNKQAAISAHYNSIKSFDYYKSKFNRNSIDGVGGNVIGIVNVTEANGTSMENAFWNGQAMFYGNGGSTFKSLARGLDVGGHEMTHGVVEKTANLLYQDESGALNESFADVFGQMIDGDLNDWKIGEDVMQSGGGLPTALRNLMDPHNGQPTNSAFWQPNHTNEQYTGSADNGGVHINSGITNRAFYLFASDATVGTVKAEQVYYKALRDYLVKSSKFIDCRIAVIQAATDLYGAAVANVAANAFTTVGIGGSTPGGNYLGTLTTNPGTDYVLCTSNDGTKLDLVLGSSGLVIKTLYSQGVKSRPSITDNGSSLVFVNDAGNIIGIDLTYGSNPPAHTVTNLFTDAWRSVAISKDGRFIAALADFQEPYIYILDIFTNIQEDFELYNPTYSQGQITGDVQYADVLEFDYSGQFLMYDSYNDLDGVGYWDVGFVQYWENDQFTDGANAFITKLFTGLPEKVSIGNPTFAKNSPYIIAFDLIDEISTIRYDIYGANSETGDYDVLVGNNGNLGWPNYNRLDNRIVYDKEASPSVYNLRLQPLAPNKIQPQGASLAFVPNHYWGVWYGNGTRSLMVGTGDAESHDFDLKLWPNPSSDFTQLSLTVKSPMDANISLHNMLGERLMARSVNLSAGENSLDIDLQNLPAGNYVLRIAAENGAGAALKLVKN